MKKIFFIACILFSMLDTFSQNINGAEYFYDTDPGIGNGTSVSVVAAGDSATANFIASTASLPVGFHTLCLRYRYSNGMWGLFEKVPFFILPTVPLNALQINRAEYFVDTDPGIGNGTVVNFTAADSANLSLVIPTNGFTPGFHTLFIRYRNTAGVWGLFESSSFYILPTVPLNPLQINRAEYFVDTDPGIGNGTAVNFTAADSANLSLVIPSNGLTTGFHTLFIRYRNTAGVWGLYESSPFFIIPTVNPIVHQLDKAEYFIDTDPGFGNATPINISPSADSASLVLNVNTTGLSAGSHTLNIRYRNTNGLWGIFITDTFNLCATPPVASITSVGSPAICTGGAVLLKADTTNGVGTTYQWRFNNVNINGATNSSYLANAVGNYNCMVQKNCANLSNTISVTINNNVFTPSVSITSNPITSCSGSPYVFTAVPQNGGVTPTYQWKRNNVNVGTNSSTYSVTPVYGDVIRCVMTSNAQCASTPTANSNSITTKFQFLGNDQIKYILPNTTRNLTNIVSFPGASYSYRKSNWGNIFIPTSVPVGVYYIIGTVNASCKDTVKITVKLGNMANKAEFDTDDKGDELSQPQFKVFPNPINEAFVLQYISDEIGTANIRLFDAAGRLVYQKEVEVQEGLNHQECEVKNLVDGMYLMQFVMGAEIKHTEKLLMRK